MVGSSSERFYVDCNEKLDEIKGGTPTISMMSSYSASASAAKKPFDATSSAAAATANLPVALR